MSTPSVQSVCILGRQPSLGLAELESLYGSKVTPLSHQVAGLTLYASEVAFNRLGGSTRLAHVLCTLPTDDWKAIERQLPELVTELSLTLPDGKIQLGLSSFGVRVSAAKLNAAGLTLKKTLRARLSRSVRVIPNPNTELNTAQVLHNHLTGPTGIELLLIAGRDGHTTIARTTAVQDINAYTFRDRGRPKRDARVGMLPPKLAQIIINLAAGTSSPQHDTTLLDPFCGTGVVLIEATMMGFGVYGTDIDPRMVSYTDQNLMWLLEQPNAPITRPVRYSQDLTWHYFRSEQGDATDHHWTPTPDVVACETYLGRPFTEKPSSELLAQTVSEVNLITKRALINIHSQLKSGTRLCLAVPAWQTGNMRFKHLPLIDQIGDMGYNRVSFEHVRDEQLLYYREDQVVARELLVLIRK